MKVIDLLNKIANGEEYRNCNLIWHSKITGQHMEENIDAGTFIYESLFYNDITLNDEVEIAEEPEEKKIPKKIKDKYCSQISKVELAQKYNEIIDYLEYLKSKGE